MNKYVGPIGWDIGGGEAEMTPGEQGRRHRLLGARRHEPRVRRPVPVWDVARGCSNEEIPGCIGPIEIEEPTNVPPTPPLSSGVGAPESGGWTATRATVAPERAPWFVVGLAALDVLRRRSRSRSASAASRSGPTRRSS